MLALFDCFPRCQLPRVVPGRLAANYVYLTALFTLAPCIAYVGCSTFNPDNAQKMIVTIWFEAIPQCEHPPAEVRLEISSEERCREFAALFQGISEECWPSAAAAVMRFEFYDANERRASWSISYDFEEIVDCSSGQSYVFPPELKAKLSRLFKEQGKDEWCEALGLERVLPREPVPLG